MEYLIHILVITGIYIILTLSLNLVVGYTGLPALGHAAFSCVGAYTSSLLALNYGITPWLGLPIAASFAAVMGVIISIPSLRLKGDYFALATFGLGIIVYSISKNWVDLTRGPLGLPGIPGFKIFYWSIDETWSYLLLVALFVALTYIVIRNIVSSPFGRILTGIREDEVATRAMGKNINRHKITAFIVSAFFAGIAGSLYAHYITFIDPSSFTVMESITILLMVVFGGLASLWGSFIGAAALVILPELLRFLGLPSSIAAPLRQMIYGLLLILLMVKRPQGILGKFRFR
ncbi:MAG: branched-chain amino acid ABC transporter permease [candidate division Zixibacteria bacterium]|nr:branched-chain amino acid ABC transporter permease [candidate division Zixibacteria bacterium]